MYCDVFIHALNRYEYVIVVTGTSNSETRNFLCDSGDGAEFFYCNMEWIAIGTNFWTLRSSFKVSGIKVKVHCSLIKLSTGKFLLIDTVKFSEQAVLELNQFTNGGRDLEAVLVTQPLINDYYTVCLSTCANMYPNAKYFGTPRHLRKIESVTWQPQSMAEPAMLRQWETEEIFMRIPEGAEFENPDKNCTFSSVHVFHKPSRTIHVSETILYNDKKPGFLGRMIGKKGDKMIFSDLYHGVNGSEANLHAFQTWVQRLIDEWDFDNICTHSGNKIGGAKEHLARIKEKSDKHFAKQRATAQQSVNTQDLA